LVLHKQHHALGRKKAGKWPAFLRMETRDFSRSPQLTAQTWAFAHGVAPCTQRYKRIGNLKLGKVRKA
jgi:hypothetical protein